MGHGLRLRLKQSSTCLVNKQTQGLSGGSTKQMADSNETGLTPCVDCTATASASTQILQRRKQNKGHETSGPLKIKLINVIRENMNENK